MATISEPAVSSVTLNVSTQSGDYHSIQEAITIAEKLGASAVAILIAAGDYFENLQIYGRHIHLIGNGKVRIIGDLSARQKNSLGDELGTFRTATCFINGQDISLTNLTIINAAGPDHEVGQAMAVYCEGNQITFKHCELRGYQDTLCLGPLPALQKNGTAFKTPALKYSTKHHCFYFENCLITGTVDFIFGGGTAYFLFCQLQVQARQNNQTAYLTAASTNPADQGFLFYHCLIDADDQQPYYLGRPWRSFAKTIFWRCDFKGQLVATGWDDWGQPKNQVTVTYAEHKCCYQNKKILRSSWIHWQE